jgi:hypothetical protein
MVAAWPLQGPTTTPNTKKVRFRRQCFGLRASQAGSRRVPPREMLAHYRRCRVLRRSKQRAPRSGVAKQEDERCDQEHCDPGMGCPFGSPFHHAVLFVRGILTELGRGTPGQFGETSHDVMTDFGLNLHREAGLEVCGPIRLSCCHFGGFVNGQYAPGNT